MKVADLPITSVAAHRDADHRNVHQLLTVREIMTPRSDFIACLGTETVNDAFRSVPEIYDALPVLAGHDRHDHKADVIGVIDRRKVHASAARERVSQHLDEVARDTSISSATPMLDFIRGLRGEPVSLVHDGEDIVGLVTLFDIERLPVRIALFALLIDIEDEIGRLIEFMSPNPSSWQEMMLTAGLKKALQDGLGRASRRDHHGSPILAVGYSVKLAILEALAARGHLGTIKAEGLRGIVDLRNDIAHGLPFKNVGKVPDHTREAIQLQTQIKSFRKGAK